MPTGLRVQQMALVTWAAPPVPSPSSLTRARMRDPARLAGSGVAGSVRVHSGRLKPPQELLW